MNPAAKKLLIGVIDEGLDKAQSIECPSDYWIYLIGYIQGALDRLDQEHDLTRPCRHQLTGKHEVKKKRRKRIDPQVA